MMVGSVKLIVNNRDLVSKVYIPKYILLFSKSLTYLFKMILSLGIVIVLMLFLNVPFSFNILYIFLIIPVLYVISFGLGCILMHFGVYVQDLVNITNITLRLVYMLSGIFYNINTRLKGSLKYMFLRVNPMAFIISEARKALLYGKMVSFKGLGIWFVIGLILCYIGIKIIAKNENSYVKVI